MSVEEFNETDTLIRGAAKAAHVPGDLLSRDDLIQDLWQFWLSRTELQEYPENTQKSILRRHARSIIAKERTDYAYFTGAYLYTPTTVRWLLQEAVWVAPFASPDIEGRIDVQKAMRSLSAKDQAVLEAAYAFNMYPNLSKTQQKRVQRAVDKLAAILNSRSKPETKDIHQVAAQGIK